LIKLPAAIAAAVSAAAAAAATATAATSTATAAATISAATTTATAAETSTAATSAAKSATSWRASFSRTRFIHRQVPVSKLPSIQFRDSFFCCRIICHFHEAEPTRLPAKLVFSHAHIVDLPVWFK
jgi:hypothetical protein